jgi:hypothetical protein
MSKSNSSSAGSKPPRHPEEVGAGAPEPSKCRAEPIGWAPLVAWCLFESPVKCRFSEPFESRWLCCHPQRERIVARAQAEARRPPGP